MLAKTTGEILFRAPWLNYWQVILLTICLTPVLPTQAYPVQSVQVAQAKSNYDNYMKLGYLATAKRDYRTALVNFRKALDVYPGNQYAIKAIDNVGNYVARPSNEKLTFITANRGAPGMRYSGATRSGGSIDVGCQSSSEPMTALVPATNRGMSTAERPTFFYYLPKTSQPLEFALLDENDDLIYRTEFAPNKIPGVVSINLSTLAGAPPLEIGKNYHWFMSIICDRQDRSTDIYVNGWIQRIEPEPALKRELQKATPKERVSLYAVNGIWHDALKTLYETRQSNPNNQVVAEEWVDLLKSVGLGAIAKQPLVDCCTPSK